MAIYIWIWIVSLTLFFICERSKILFALFGVTLIIIAGARDIDVGTDTYSYYSIFNTVAESGYASWVEPFWNITCYICYFYVSSNYNVFLFIVATITIVNYFYVFYKDSPYPFLSIFIFISLHIYTGSFNIIRQYYAMSFLLLSWHFSCQNKKIKSIFVLFISLFTHYSIIFSLVIYLWNKLSLSTVKIFFLLFVSFIFGSLMNENILSVFLGSLFSNFLDKETVFRDNSTLVFIMVIAQNLVTLAVVFLVKKDLKDSFWFKIFILSSIVFNSTYMIAFAARIYMVFAMSQIVFLPILVKQVETKYKPILFSVLLIYMSAQFFRILISNGNGILPYSSVLFH